METEDILVENVIKIIKVIKMEPVEGIEPPTLSLQKICSAAELYWQNCYQVARCGTRIRNLKLFKTTFGLTLFPSRNFTYTDKLLIEPRIF